MLPRRAKAAGAALALLLVVVVVCWAVVQASGRTEFVMTARVILETPGSGFCVLNGSGAGARGAMARRVRAALGGRARGRLTWVLRTPDRAVAAARFRQMGYDVSAPVARPHQLLVTRSTRLSDTALGLREKQVAQLSRRVRADVLLIGSPQSACRGARLRNEATDHVTPVE